MPRFVMGLLMVAALLAAPGCGGNDSATKDPGASTTTPKDKPDSLEAPAAPSPPPPPPTK